MTRLSFALIVAAIAAIAATKAAAWIEPCDDCLTARLWPTTAAEFPETSLLKVQRPNALDLGFAFAGGGTRSASATTGQLRGLKQNEWLDKARYIAAVSGGAWAAIPFTYTEATDADLLGPSVLPQDLQFDAVNNCPDGRLAASLGADNLPRAGFREAAWRVASPALKKDSTSFIKLGLSKLLARREGDRGEKTYSRFIGDLFIDPIIDPVDMQASHRLFAWDGASLDQAIGDNPGKLSHIQFITSDATRRPYLIVGGTVVSMRDIYDYPLLMPIEYTPIYTGIRHRFGEKFGGHYISSWAYDHIPAGPAAGNLLQVHQGASNRNFTIADVAAATGAAPALGVLLGERYDALPSWAQSASGAIADFFPSFRHVTVQGDGGVIVSAPTPHGDGGFTDNFGLMPLLARGVKNIIVFANVNGEFGQNDDLASYFEAVPNPGATGNKSLNTVFKLAGYNAMKKQFLADKLAGRPLVYCNADAGGSGWSVLPNAIYEVKPYDGLHICWVYIHAADAWSKQITDTRLQAQLAGKDFSTFPWYDTFKQLKLDTPHVNLLADLTSWVLTDAQVIKRIRAAIPALPDPPAHTPAVTIFTKPQCVVSAALRP